MKEDTLKKLKIAINNEKQVLKLKKRKFAEAKELEQNEYVRRYLELCGIVTAIKEIREDKNVEIKVFNSFVSSIDPSETNKIFIYAGTYTYDDRGMVRVKESSIAAEYHKYWDIEQKEPFFLPIEECEKFESENTVILGSIDSVREVFLKNLLESDQEKAVTLVKTKYKTKKSIF